MKTGQAFLDANFFAEAKLHCAKALQLAHSNTQASACLMSAQAGIDLQRHERFASRATLLSKLIDTKSLTAAETEIKSLRDFETDETKNYGPLKNDDERQLDRLGIRLANVRNEEWPTNLPTDWGLRRWLPAMVEELSHAVFRFLYILVFVLAAVLVVSFLSWLRSQFGRWFWREKDGPIAWTVYPISDETNQLAAGAVIDALNIYHNPLFRELGTSSFLAAPPELTKQVDGTDLTSTDPSYLIWQNFLIEKSLGRKVREYLAKTFEYIDLEKFTRHTFNQVDAFEDMDLKLGVVEASFGALYRNGKRWLFKGWPSVTGAVTVEEVGESSYASIRLVCNYAVRQKPTQTPAIADDLLSDTRTLAVFASTKVDDASDAVALASQRAAFRLLYRLVEDPNQPNLAIASSSYRQGVRHLQILF